MTRKIIFVLFAIAVVVFAIGMLVAMFFWLNESGSV